MNKELIEKLRLMAFESVDNDEATMLHEAADALEAKAAPVGERESFEAAYAAEYSAARGVECTASDIAGMRKGDGYGDRPYLNGQWKGFQAGAAYQRQSGVVVPHDLLIRVLEPVTSEQYINSKRELLALMREFARLNGAGSHE